MSIKKKLRYFFELQFMPNVSLFLFNSETWLRLLALKKLFRNIDPNNVKRIIDVGGGTGRLELALKRTNVFIYDANKESIDIAKQNFVNAVVGDGPTIDFEDNYFDWAISIHTLEHIPQVDREHFILQMIRVSKEGVFLNFPEGEYARKLCCNYLESLNKNGKEPNKWTLEHLEMGVPMVEEINEIIKKQDKFIFEYVFIRNYKRENNYWVDIRGSNNIIKAYFLSPFNSLMKYMRYRKLPTVELLLVGTRTELETKRILNNL